MNQEPEEYIAGTVTLTPAEKGTLEPSRMSSALGSTLIYHVNGREIKVGGADTGFWLLMKWKHLSYINALFQWFLDHENEVQWAILDAHYARISKSLTDSMQWYYTEGYEDYMKNFPEFAEPGFNVGEPSCQERIISRQELYDNTAVDEIGLDYENRRIEKVTFYLGNHIRENAPERITQMLAEIDGDFIECSYLVKWDDPDSNK